MTLEDLKTYTELNGVMFTVRYIVERGEWFGIYHQTKVDSVDTYRDTLEEVVDDLIKKAEKRYKKELKLVDKAATGE